MYHDMQRFVHDVCGVCIEFIAAVASGIANFVALLLNKAVILCDSVGRQTFTLFHTTRGKT
jgi:hypothetical protein